MTDPNQYQPTPDGRPDPGLSRPGQQPPPAAPAVASLRKPLLVAVATFVGVLALAAGGLAVYDGFIKEDSGVAACRAMSEGRLLDGSAKDPGDDELTEAEYREARKIFEDSRKPEIREHGTALVDILWQLQDAEDSGGAFGFLAPMSTHVSGLRTACADEGFILKMDD